MSDRGQKLRIDVGYGVGESILAGDIVVGSEFFVGTCRDDFGLGGIFGAWLGVFVRFFPRIEG